ncbi:MAG: DNA cytosine methyltransferase [Holophagaceae bacterium]|nr:DNA cytosine methyltransferase [Holophagaceae bacterium]
MTAEALTSLEICAGAGGQALGLEMAEFNHVALVEIDPHARKTLKHNRDNWNILPDDVKLLDGKQFKGIELFAGGVPCPPFSIAGKQLGNEDERDLFPAALRLIRESKPIAVMLENVKGLANSKFEPYRADLLRQLSALGYESSWEVIHANDYGVPQLRPRFILVALKPKYAKRFSWPNKLPLPPTVGEELKELMASRGWPGASDWSQAANSIAPTLVGGSKKHGGADLGPTRAKRQWAELQVDGMGLANEPPGPDFPVDGRPRLTVEMAALLQGFPKEWKFLGGKTAAYRQVGNAFPPPVAAEVGKAIRKAIHG